MTDKQINLWRTNLWRKYRKALMELQRLESEKSEDSWKLNDIEFENLVSMFEDMPRQHHELKTETQYYQAIEKGLKQFELRKNDRDFKVGDILTLKETVNATYTGRTYICPEIKYILHGGKYGLEEGYCILGW